MIPPVEVEPAVKKPSGAKPFNVPGELKTGGKNADEMQVL
ncbi:hypothetical protein TAM4_2431 [Thermococcus sp. AM4]|nr:hypothetical protein TAM4_2431 [Thermococcus sp. AM4]